MEKITTDGIRTVLFLTEQDLRDGADPVRPKLSDFSDFDAVRKADRVFVTTPYGNWVLKCRYTTHQTPYRVFNSSWK